MKAGNLKRVKRRIKNGCQSELHIHCHCDNCVLPFYGLAATNINDIDGTELLLLEVRNAARHFKQALCQFGIIF